MVPRSMIVYGWKLMGAFQTGSRLALMAAGALSLSGCASIAGTCSQYSAAFYDECAAAVRQSNARRVGIMGAALAGASRTPDVATPTGPVAFLKSQYEQGSAKVCVYDRLGSPYVITIERVQLCPLTVQ
jgi:hypothetical protein